MSTGYSDLSWSCVVAKKLKFLKGIASFLSCTKTKINNFSDSPTERPYYSLFAKIFSYIKDIDEFLLENTNILMFFFRLPAQPSRVICEINIFTREHKETRGLCSVVKIFISQITRDSCAEKRKENNNISIQKFINIFNRRKIFFRINCM